MRKRESRFVFISDVTVLLFIIIVIIFKSGLTYDFPVWSGKFRGLSLAGEPVWRADTSRWRLSPPTGLECFTPPRILYELRATGHAGHANDIDHVVL